MSKQIGIALCLFGKKAFLRCQSNKMCLTALSRQFHKGNVCYDEGMDKMKQEVYPFMSSLKGDLKARQEIFEYDEPWKHQPLVIFGSFLIFLVYFGVVRKEREVDEAIAETLYKGMPALEVSDLRKKIKEYNKKGKDTEVLDARLKELLTPPQNKNL